MAATQDVSNLEQYCERKFVIVCCSRHYERFCSTFEDPRRGQDSASRQQFWTCSKHVPRQKWPIV
jgi:hypothetical protein